MTPSTANSVRGEVDGDQHEASVAARQPPVTGHDARDPHGGLGRIDAGAEGDGVADAEPVGAREALADDGADVAGDQRRALDDGRVVELRIEPRIDAEDGDGRPQARADAAGAGLQVGAPLDLGRRDEDAGRRPDRVDRRAASGRSR